VLIYKAYLSGVYIYMIVIKLTKAQFNMLKSLMLDGDQNLQDRINEDYENNWNFVKEMYGNKYHIIRKNLFTKLRLKS
jgi:hypothetical protein